MNRRLVIAAAICGLLAFILISRLDKAGGPSAKRGRTILDPAQGAVVLPTNDQHAKSILSGNRRGKHAQDRAGKGEVSEESIPVFSNDGTINYAAVRALALTKEEAVIADKLIKEWRASIADTASTVLSLDEEQCDLENGVSAFVIEPFAEEFYAIKESIYPELADAIGAERAEKLMKGVLASEEFQNWGYKTMNVQFQTHEDRPMVSVTIVIMDPESNKPVGRWSSSLDTRPIGGTPVILSKIFDVADPNRDLLGRKIRENQSGPSEMEEDSH